MEYFACLNCCNGYSSELKRCPYCGTSKGKESDGEVIFDDLARVEITTLGGIILNLININGISSYIIPCELGVVRFDRNLSVRWTYYSGSLREIKLFNQENLELITSTGSIYLDIDTGAKIDSNPIPF